MRPLSGLCADLLSTWATRPDVRDDFDRQLRLLLKQLGAHPDAPAREPPPQTPRTDYRQTRTFREIQNKFGFDPTLPVFVAMAEKIAAHVPIRAKLGRAVKRRKDLMYDWFEAHIDDAIPIFDPFQLLNSDGQRIDHRREYKVRHQRCGACFSAVGSRARSTGM
jgi:hypothetical protein